ncbi:hypothetical protein ACNKHT_00790 [Shigella flexneri]
MRRLAREFGVNLRK